MTDTTAPAATPSSEGTQTQSGATDTTINTNIAADDGAQTQQTSDDKTTEKPGDAPADGKESEGDKPADDKDGKEGDKPEGAPEAYEDFKAPEGIVLDPEMSGELKAIAKEFNLSQENAQKVADLGVKLQQKWTAQNNEAIQKVQTEWVESTKADKEFGGEKLQENLAVAKKALNSFGSPELRTLLNESGLGNHPEVIRTFIKIGKQISEDAFVPAGNGTPKTDNTASVLYPNSKMK